MKKRDTRRGKRPPHLTAITRERMREKALKQHHYKVDEPTREWAKAIVELNKK